MPQTMHCIPIDPALWKVDRFKDFISERRRLIARGMNEYLAQLVGSTAHLEKVGSQI